MSKKIRAHFTANVFLFESLTGLPFIMLLQQDSRD